MHYSRPLYEMMEVTRGTAYGLAMSQLLLTLGAVLFFPAPVVELLWPAPVLNGTRLAAAGPLLDGRASGLYLALPLLVSSGLVVLYSTTTLGLSEQGALGADYTQDALDQAGMWDALFWAYALCSHLLLGAALLTPVDAYALALSVCLQLYFLRRGCAPRGRELSLTHENLSMLGYFLGVALAAYCVPESPVAGPRLTCLFVLLIMDYFAALGHTWDREATLDTITNCRLFYVCASSMGLAALYACAVELLGC
jgi:hypothetical protein